MDIILHTHEHLSLPGLRMNLKCSKFQEVPNQASINAFTTMYNLYDVTFQSDFDVEYAKSCTFLYTNLQCKDSFFWHTVCISRDNLRKFRESRRVLG